ncbi:MAG: S24 family peptidase [Eubacteriales bacterium]|nr:S24 family peptidase [Eubacteriales bacterium]
MTTGERLRTRRKELGISADKIAEVLGVSRATVFRYEKGDIEKLPGSMLEPLAKILHTTPAFLMGWEEDGTLVRMSGHGILIPVLGRVQAGIPIEAVEEILDYEEITPEMAATGDHFALRIQGSSMEPRMREGDIIIVRKQDVVYSGDTAVVLVNGDEATVKQIKMSHIGITLIPTNPAFDPIFYSHQEVEDLPVRIIGKVVELRAKY